MIKRYVLGHIFSALLIPFLLCAAASGNALAGSAEELSEDEFNLQFQSDISLLKTYVANIERTMALIREDPVLFNIKRTGDFSLQERNRLYRIWENLLDHIVAFDRVNSYYGKYYLTMDKDRHAKAFLLAYASYIFKFAYSLEFISRTINNELYEKKLDDENPDFNIPPGMYAKLKWNTIHISDVSSILAGRAYYQLQKKKYRQYGLTTDDESAWIFSRIQSLNAYIRKELRLKGIKYFTANGLDILKDSALSAWFPVQMNVATWMGNTKVRRKNRFLITEDQIAGMERHLRAGDIIITRKNWYLSNVGLPGFWPHAELYAGTYQDMKDYFNDTQVVEYYRSLGDYRDFMDYLRKKYPGAMEEYQGKAHDGNPVRVIEAVSKGVKFSSLEEAALADYVAVMRPRLSKLDIARAVDEAFHYLGRPYDYNFDFLTDSSIVCSELIYKIYMKGRGKEGLHIELQEMAGRKVAPPNSIVEKFDHEYGKPEQELDFVYFLDGSEKNGTAEVRGPDEFRKSHKRLKWDIAQK